MDYLTDEFRKNLDELRANGWKILEPIGLSRTAELMLSEDYKERFLAEYWQVKIRMKKLEQTPTEFVDRDIKEAQLSAMEQYMKVLEERAELQEIDLQTDRFFAG